MNVVLSLQHMTNGDFIMMSLWKKFKKFYAASPENRIGFYNFLAFIVVPVIGMTLLYIFVHVFWL